MGPIDWTSILLIGNITRSPSSGDYMEIIFKFQNVVTCKLEWGTMSYYNMTSGKLHPSSYLLLVALWRSKAHTPGGWGLLLLTDSQDI